MVDDRHILERRDARAIPHLEQYAPVWLVDQRMVPQDDAVLFNVVFQHHLYGWVNRRYKFDAFNDVLYHMGQNRVTDEDALDIQEDEPWVAVTVADIPNAYGG